MNDMERLAKGIVNAKLPKQKAILTSLGQIYQHGSEYEKVKLREMADSYKAGVSLSQVFMSGFNWDDTPEGHMWWSTNAHSALKRRKL